MSPKLLRGLSAGLLLVAASTYGARCEVGAAIAMVGPEVTRLEILQLAIIGDDPVPFGAVWRPFAPGAPGRVILNPDGEANGDGPPSVVSDPATGLDVVAWSRSSASGFDIVVSRFTNGAWTTPQVVIGSPANDLDPQLVLDASGNIHMLYWVDGATPEVFHVQAPADLSSWSPAALVSQSGEAACRPAGAMFHGELHVAYEVHDFGYGNSPRQVVLARFANGTFVPETVALTNNLGEVRPEVHTHAGRLWVDWIDAETSGGSGEVAWSRIDAQGHWESIRYEPFANPEQRDHLVRGGVRMKAIK